jgi:hypothetical protein
MLSKTSFLIVVFIFPSLVYASDEEYVELQSRFTKFHIEYVVKDDLSVERVSELEIKSLSEKAARQLKEQRFSHSTSIEKFEVLDAYTIKSDGTKIDVPKDNYQVTVNKGKEDGGPVFSDRTRVTIVFPEVEKLDSIYMKVKNIETQPMFPGHFSVSQYFWNQTAYDDVRIQFNLPENLVFKHQVRGMKQKVRSKGGRKIIILTYDNKKPVKSDRLNYSVWNEDEEVGYALSTFESYEAIAKAYGDRASPKAVPTDRVKKLAKEIIGKEKSRKDRARLLYDWVAGNITYAGNCIGVGAVVPHDVDFILDNRMGDCKDHATLLQALLSSVDIKSTQALVNSGPVYTLPEIPVVMSVNHVINYIPEWDKFVDSTDSAMPFDSLGLSISDKPVLLVGDFQENKKIPPTKVGTNFQELASTMNIQNDGSVTGDISIKLKGRPAIEARGSWRYVTQEQEKEWLESVFSSQKKIGSATIKKDDPVPLLSDYKYSFEFNKPDFILPKGTGAFYIGPLVSSPLAVYSLLDYPQEDIEGHSVACASGHSIEHLVYVFPENMKILAKPDNFEVKENYIHYKSTYVLNNNRLEVVREVDDRTPGNVCSDEFVNAQRQTLMEISDHLKTQVVYQYL